MAVNAGCVYLVSTNFINNFELKRNAIFPMIKLHKACYFLLLSLLCCRKPYNPPAIASPRSYLVVEGVINSGSDSTFIKLSQTVSLSSTVTVNPVLHAVLTVESDQNAIYPLTETSNGYYASAGLNLDNTRQYRLRIQTNGEQYLSDFVPVVNSPAIDTVSYNIQSNGVQLNASTHDPKNNTHYYRWSYNETWIFHSDYDSQFMSNGDTVVARPANDQIYQCWASDTSSTIVLGSSAALSKDIINNKQITLVASTSEKLGVKYSILVNQYALTGDAYNFWVNLKKNTEQLGSIFDAQPSEINSNIHDITNPSVPVIGFVSVGAVANKRIFITEQQLPRWTPVNPYPDSLCDFRTFLFHAPILGTLAFYNQENVYFNYLKNNGAGELYIPVDALSRPGGPVTGHTGALPICVDCTLRGTNIQPGFWR